MKAPSRIVLSARLFWFAIFLLQGRLTSLRSLRSSLQKKDRAPAIRCDRTTDDGAWALHHLMCSKTQESGACFNRGFMVKKIYDKKGNYACRWSEITLDVRHHL